MPQQSKSERDRASARMGRWAAVNLVVALVLVLTIGAVQLHAELADAEGLTLLAGLGVLALVSAGLLFRSFLDR